MFCPPTPPSSVLDSGESLELTCLMLFSKPKKMFDRAHGMYTTCCDKWLPSTSQRGYTGLLTATPPKARCSPGQCTRDSKAPLFHTTCTFAAVWKGCSLFAGKRSYINMVYARNGYFNNYLALTCEGEKFACWMRSRVRLLFLAPRSHSVICPQSKVTLTGKHSSSGCGIWFSFSEFPLD